MSKVRVIESRKEDKGFTRVIEGDKPFKTGEEYQLMNNSYDLKNCIELMKEMLNANTMTSERFRTMRNEIYQYLNSYYSRNG